MNSCFSTSSRRTRTPGPVTTMRVPSGDITPPTSSEPSPDPAPTTSPDLGSTRRNVPSRAWRTNTDPSGWATRSPASDTAAVGGYACRRDAVSSVRTAVPSWTKTCSESRLKAAWTSPTGAVRGSVRAETEPFDAFHTVTTLSGARRGPTTESSQRESADQARSGSRPPTRVGSGVVSPVRVSSNHSRPDRTRATVWPSGAGREIEYPSSGEPASSPRVSWRPARATSQAWISPAPPAVNSRRSSWEKARAFACAANRWRRSPVRPSQTAATLSSDEVAMSRPSWE